MCIGPVLVACRRKRTDALKCALPRLALATQRDYIQPLEERGQDVEANVQGLCAACHDAKSAAERARGVQRAWAGYRER